MDPRGQQVVAVFQGVVVDGGVCTGSRGFLGGWVEAVCSVGAQLVREVIRSVKSVAHHIISTPAALEVLLWLSHGLEVHFDLHGEYHR